MSGTVSETNLRADAFIFRETNSVLILFGVSPAHIEVATDQPLLEHICPLLTLNSIQTI